MKKVTIQGMACQHCAKSVAKALTELGASNVSVDLEGGYATADLDADAATVWAAIESRGFTVVDVSEV
jgi:copper chaperone CopZ